MIIYKVTNLINGKIYIGKTVFNLEKRKKRHLTSVYGRSYRSCFHKAIKKYGQENFKWEIIDQCLFREKLSELEQYYIRSFDCVSPKGMNLTIGGDGVLGHHHSPETRARISASMTGKVRTAEHRENLKAALQYRSPETRAKMSAASIGRSPSMETRIKLSIINTGKRASVETRKKLSDMFKGRYFSPEHKRKLSAAKMGHEVSVEARKKISIAGKARFSDPKAREKISLAKMNPSPETRKRISDAAKAAWAKRKVYWLAG